MRVLIAEDDFTSRSILTAILAKWGYEVVSAADGDEAWPLSRNRMRRESLCSTG